MKSLQSILFACAVAGFVLPGVSAAADNKDTTGTVEHRGEVGTVDHSTPKSSATKAQVRKELDAAHKSGTHQTGGEAGPLKEAPASGKTKSRAQVKAELDAAHKAGTHQTGGDKPQN